MQQNDFNNLLDKYLDGTANPLEKKLVEEHLRILEETGKADISQNEMENTKASVLAGIREQMQVHKIPVYRKNWFRTAAAAIIILALTGSAYLFLNKSSTAPVLASKTALDQITPGKNGAILTLSNGQQVLLDSAINGQLTTQGATEIIKQNGELQYRGNNNENIINTVSTNRGRQWLVVLPDGSRAWLNSASSISYSLNFSGKTREVTTSGEVYFEIAKDARRPFKVRVLPFSNREGNLSPAGGSGGAISDLGQNKDRRDAEGGQLITVLGTSFNVNAYKDENVIRTTLVEGSIKVLKDNQQILLKPGQQTQLTTNGILSAKNDIDVQQVLAWKTGFFEFRDLDLESVMRQVSRWYDIDIKYEGVPGKETFGGRIAKNVNLATVLKGLEITGVKFRLENNQLIVTSPPLKKGEVSSKTRRGI